MTKYRVVEISDKVFQVEKLTRQWVWEPLFEDGSPMEFDDSCKACIFLHGLLVAESGTRKLKEMQELMNQIMVVRKDPYDPGFNYIGAC